MSLSDQRRAFQSVLVTFVLCLFVRVPQWLTYFSKSTLNQLDADFIFFPYILNNITEYQNSLMADSVEKIASSFGLLVDIVSLAGSMGMENGTMLMLFFCIQIILGLIGVYMIAKGLGLSQNEIVLTFCFFLISYFTQFGRYIGGPGIYNKVVTSCLAMSIGYIIIGLFVNGRLIASLGLSALLAYIHPTYAFIFISIIAGYLCWMRLVKKSISIRQAVIPIVLALTILIPFIGNMVTSASDIVGAGIEPIWWDFLKAKTSNPFPMQDGIIIVIPTLAVFAITLTLLGALGRYTKLDSYHRSQWVLGAIILMWLVQIVFTEIIPLSFIARLALTRTTPFALFFMELAYVVIIWRHRHEDKSGIWMVLLMLPVLMNNVHIIPREAVVPMIELIPGLPEILGGYGQDFHVYPEMLILFVFLTLYIHSLGKFDLRLSSNKAMAAARNYLNKKRCGWFILLLVCSLLVINMIKLDPKGLLLFGAVLVISIGWLREKNYLCVISNFFNQKKYVFISTILVFALTPAILHSTSTFKNYKNEISDIEQMWDFIEKNTEKGEMILVVPFFDTRKYPIMPLRPIFIDWSEAQMVLYNSGTTHTVLKRLELMGMDVRQAMAASEEQCAGFRQYTKAMCRRIVFEQHSHIYSDAWRGKLSEMKATASNLSYVLMQKDHLHVNDKPLYAVGQIALLAIDDVFR